MKCPGQDTQYWKPGAIYEVPCPECGGVVEFFKDDTSRKCGHCGHRFVNPQMDFGCAAYCQFAAECLGTLPPEVVAGREDLLKDRVAVEMKRYHRADFHKIGRASRTARYAETISKAEGGSMAMVLMAAYLYDMPPQDAQGILEKLGAPKPLLQGVLNLVNASDAVSEAMTINLGILTDARRLSALEERLKAATITPEILNLERRNGFFTKTGGSIAEKLFSTVHKT
jgi:hypothetical protein